ncbi:electron transfer flavoprotein subunit beta/FixA family protein [Saccharopolyspora endophytica]|uniref:Electron transfer flavoprotein subunit beta n=1 Tax=Saccharopolyspora endophytica TaxID=543886 RepID=A0ABS5DBF7_9PSEU|nr:electron transfer flavoprotein subunit beta/FixA family protein [Saccharopolyspora endophytica]MBQ0923497.1 electron transfer flavoprotein subunit beta/FixA family protein [Saccharopolyspora endophytica]
MNVVVLVKQVPDTYSERKLAAADHTLDREAADAVLDEINERAVEEALQITESQGGEVTAVCMGPNRATEAIRKALSMGAHKAVHLSDDALAGTDAPATARALAAAIGTVESVDLVIAGNEATDGRTGAVPAMLAELLGLPQLTYVRKLSTDGSVVTAARETDAGIVHLQASLPAVVSVTEKINEPRYPSFKGIMAAKKKPVTVLSAADAGIDPTEFGLANAGSQVVESAPKPPKQAGQRVTDEGEGGIAVAEYLTGQKLV